MTQAQLKQFPKDRDQPSEGLGDFVSRIIVPILSKATPEETTQDGMSTAMKWPILGGFAVFGVIFFFFERLMVDNVIGNILTVLAFPILFLTIMAGSAFMFRNRLAELIIRGQERFLIRTEAMHAISETYDLEYVPLPGGVSRSIKAFLEWRYCPKTLKDIYHLMDDHGGFDDTTDIIRASGLAMPRAIVLGSEKARQHYYRQQLDAQQFEDGFKGTRAGIDFAALEWTETHDETSTHHLLLALTLPTKLTGRVEFKNKAARWPMAAPDTSHKKVGLLSKDFSKAYSVRASDQMEAHLIFDPVVIEKLTAYSADDAVRGVAYDNHLVIDLAGSNRFDILDLMTGGWSEQSIANTLGDFTQMLDFVDSVAHAFSVKRN